MRDRSASAARTVKHYEVRSIQAEPAQNITGVGLVRVSDTQGGHLGFFFRGRDVYIFDCITPAAQLDQVEPLSSSSRCSGACSIHEADPPGAPGAIATSAFAPAPA